QAAAGKQVADYLVPLLNALPMPMPTANPEPQYLTAPGQFALAQDGSVFTMDVNGVIYRDALVFGDPVHPFHAQKFCVFGVSYYAKGKTDNSWWKFVGGTLPWGSSPVTAIDVSILN